MLQGMLLKNGNRIIKQMKQFERLQCVQSMKQREQQTISELAAKIASRPARHHLRKARNHYHSPDLIGIPKRKNTGDIQVQELEQGDMLKTICHQKRALFEERWLQLVKIHEESPCNQENYKHFLMIASQANYRKLQHPGYFKQLIDETSKYPSSFFSCIDKDIPRTLVDGHPFQPALRNILYCYAIRNPSLLYCQGMNYIVAFLLINGFSQEQGFWFMVQLIEDIVMPDYFKDLSTISVTVQIFEDVIRQVFPQFSQELQQVGMESGIFLVTWYICLFTKGFINSVSEYLLEMVILQTRKYPIGFVLVKISLGILATLFTREQRFEFQKDFRSLKESIQNNVYQIALDQLKKGLSYFQFNLSSYQELSKIYQNKRQKNFAKAIQKQLKQKKLSLPPCDIQSPVCLHRVQIEKKIGCVEEVLILKNKIPIQDQMIEEYFPKHVQRGPPKINYESPEQCTITHHRHVCIIPKNINNFTPKVLTVQKSEYFPVQQLQSSAEQVSRFSKVEDKFNQFSSFFVVQQNEQNELQQNVLQTSIEDNIGLQSGKKLDREFEINEKEEKQGQKNRFTFSVGTVFKKAIQSIKLLKNTNFSSVSAQN